MALDVGSLLSAVPVPALDAGDCSTPRPWSAGNGGGEAVSGAVPVLFGDDEALKRDLVAWAKAVASMARESAQQFRC
uniref:Uncharacterized protein n=1 Tax=Setaria viridis TaxID=4556 RepID=A0A4U6U3L5_SETVI|nr:hypothetical protein SEVIR_7G127450v2 [Setaria viridis]